MSRRGAQKLGRALLAGGVLAPLTAGAIGDDRVELFAEHEITRDDNVFRLSDELDPQTVIGSDARDDTFQTTTAGLTLDLPVSRQKISGAVAVNRVRFDRFSELDLDGHRANLLWEWVVGDRWSGRLGYGQSETLASLANVQGGVQVNSANFLTVSEADGSARYKLTERWHLVAAASRTEHDNSSEESRISDATITGQEIAVRYVTPAGSEFGVSASQREADLPVQQAIGQTIVDNSYEQQTVSAMADWAVTADSRLRATAGQVEREHRDLPERDYSGGVYSLAWDWQAADSLSLAIEKRKGISPYEQVNVGFVLLDSLTLRGHWRITDKVALTASFIDGDREYLGLPGQGAGGAEPRREAADMFQVEFSYRPLDFLELGVDWRKDARSASVPFGDYDANVVTFRVRGEF